MANEVKFRLNTRDFDAALRKYATLSKSEHADIINRKAFFIARHACRLTKRSDPKAIRALRERAIIGTGTKYNKSGVGKAFTLRAGLASSLAARILIGRRIRSGQSIPTKRELVQEVRKFIAARLRSRAYLASGWLPAIKKLALVVRRKGGSPSTGPAKTFGREKGKAIPAVSGWKVRATIENSTGFPGKYSQTQPKALARFGTPALQAAVSAETAGTLAEIARRLKGTASTAGIKTT